MEKSMLTFSELGHLLRGNRVFWFKRMVTAVAPGSVYLLLTSPSLQIRLAAGILFAFSASHSGSWSVVGFLVKPVFFTIKFRKTSTVEDEDLPWILRLSNVRIKNHALKLVKGLDNAFTNKLKKSITFGDELYSRLTME